MNKRTTCIIVGILVALIGYWQVPKIVKRVKHHHRGFSSASLAPCDKKEATTPAPEEIVHALNQPYIYLDQGGQIYAFMSIDGQYVLKFFQQKRLSAQHYLEYMPDYFLVKKLRKQKAKEKRERNQELMQSQQLAQLDLAKETGVIYTHLQGNGFPGQVQLLDKRGKML